MTLPGELAAGPLVLRRWRETDLNALMEAIDASLPELQAFMPWAVDVDAGREEAFLRRAIDAFDEGMFFAYAVVESASGTLVGGCGFHVIEPAMLEIGYWIHSAYTRRGFATQATEALTRAAFEQSAVDAVRIRCDVANGASAGIPRKLGFRYDGEMEMRAVALRQTGRSMVWVMTHETFDAAGDR